MEPIPNTPTDEPPRVAYQGEPGAFSEEAVLTYFEGSATPVPCPDFQSVGRAVVDGSCAVGLLPIENSLAGSVIGSFDVLTRGELEVIGEVVRPIRLNLLGLPGSEIAGLREAVSHPVALQQCHGFFAAHPNVKPVAGHDTAGAARDVATRGDPGVAAIASAGAGRLYGMVTLAEDLQDRSDNQTRFLVVIPRTRALDDLHGPNDQTALGGDSSDERRMKTLLMLQVADEPGSLMRILQPFSEEGINLCKIESRPAGDPWSYRFYLELEADASDPTTRAILERIRTETTQLLILGSFPRWQG
jgi:prephenate dehydratase